MLVVAFLVLGLGGLVGREDLGGGRLVGGPVGLVVGRAAEEVGAAAFALLAPARPRPAAAGAFGVGLFLEAAAAVGAGGGAEEEEAALTGRPRAVLGGGLEAGGGPAEKVVATGTVTAALVTASSLCSMRELRRMV